jgi:hypothetical protein
VCDDRRPTANFLSRLAQEALDHDLASSDAYTLHRILRGVPEGQTDMPAMQAFPMDSNLDVMGGRNKVHLLQLPFV